MIHSPRSARADVYERRVERLAGGGRGASVSVPVAVLSHEVVARDRREELW